MQSSRFLRAALAVGAMVGALASVQAAAAPAPARWTALTQLSFQHLSPDQGLPNEITTAIAEDGEGFLWVGTLGGVARWDGYRFRVYRGDPRTAGALPDNVVQTLHGDAAGRLWVGTSSAGIVRYDRDNERFVAYPVGANGLSHVSVRSIVDDGGGGLWVATDAGLDHLDPATGAIRPGPPVAGAHAGRVNTLLRDRSGALWAGTPEGLFRRDRSAQRFVAIALPAQAQPQCLFQDSAGRVWVGTLQHGAFVIDTPDAAPRAVAETQPLRRGPVLAAQQISDIGEAQPGEIWIATIGQGIVVVDLAAGQTRRIRNVPTLPLTLADNALRALYRDRSGLMWVGSNRGLSRHAPRQSAVLTMFGNVDRDSGTRAGTEVSWVLPAPDGRVWLGTHKNGVEIVDPVQGFVGALRPDSAQPEKALPDDIVLALERAGDGSVFIGTKRGLYRASADGRRVARVPIGRRDVRASTWALHADGNTLWIGGQNDGLWKLDIASGAAEPVLRSGETLSDERIIVIAPAGGGMLWVGTRFGLNHVDPASGRVRRLLPAPGGLAAGFITALFTDSKRQLWVGTYGGGIHRMEGDVAAPRFTRIAGTEGLPDDNVNAILEQGGALWASTDNGIARIDRETLAVQALRRADGVVFATYWTGSAARTPQGELLFGANGGMTIIRPDRLRPWAYQPPLAVTDLQVGGRRLNASRFTTRGAPALPVPADNNSLTVEFAALDYSAPERNRYAYRLEGFDADWIEADATRRLASYTNLPPGNYSLLLRGSNREGTWTPRALALPLAVQPAWHQTVWFRAAAAGATLALVLAVVIAATQGRTRALRARQAELERKVGERTAELEAVSRALAEKSRILEHSSITDPLTGLHNRRFLTDHIEREIGARARRSEGTDCVFFLIDVDHFKRVNDLYGHGAGDAVLVQFGRRLQTVLRGSDHLVRWGGEEFLAVAGETGRGRADELAERLRGVVAEAPFVSDDGRMLQVTCSVGFACAPFLPHDPQAFAWPDVLQIADVALYAAKRSGRNTWVGFQAGPSARAVGLLERLRSAPQDAVRTGEIVVGSNRGSDAVFAALEVRDPRAAVLNR